MADDTAPKPYQSTSPEWDIATRRIWLLILLGLATLSLILLWDSVIPMAAAGLLVAYLLFPVATFLQRRVTAGSRSIASIIVVLFFLILLVISILTIIPTILVQSVNVISALPDIFNRLFTEPLVIDGETMIINNNPIIFSELFSDYVTSRGFDSVEDLFISQAQQIQIPTVTDFATDILSTVTGSAFSILGSTFGLALNTLFFFTIVFHFLNNGSNFTQHFITAMPDGYQADVQHLLRELGLIWNDYLRGQIILSLIIGTAMYILAVLLGLPNPLFLALFAGLMEFLPNIGPTLAVVPAAFVALFTGGLPLAITVLVLWLFVQQAEGVFLIPTIVGGSLNLHPVVVIFAVIGGASLGGLVGILIAAPTVASVRLLAQYFYGKAVGKPPFPPERDRTQNNQFAPFVWRVWEWIEHRRSLRKEKGKRADNADSQPSSETA